MAGFETAIAMLEDVFLNTSFLGQYWLMQLTIVVASMALITRKVGDWKTLAFPMVLGWHYFGLTTDWIVLTIAGTIFVIDNMSMKMIEGAIGTVQETWKNMTEGTPRVSRQMKEVGLRKSDIKEMASLKETKRALDIRREMEKLREYQRFDSTDEKVIRLTKKIIDEETLKEMAKRKKEKYNKEKEE